MILLIGLPGVGKSTLGKAVAQSLDYSFIDLDSVIEKEIETSIASYIGQFGEEFFRIKEAQCLRSLTPSIKTIVSCGGGCPCFHNNIAYLKHIGKVVYLSLDLQILKQRFIESKLARPLQNQSIEAYLDELHSNRSPIYQLADVNLTLSGDYRSDINKITRELSLV